MKRPKRGSPKESSKALKRKKRTRLELTANSEFTGLCEGLSRWSGINVTFIRIVFLLSVLWYGIGILAYFILVVALPDEQPLSANGDTYTDGT